MKRIAAVCLTMAMVLSMSIGVFGAFISSPSNNPAPVIVSATPDDDNCDAQLKVTPYSDRDSLSDELRRMLEEAYDQITNNKGAFAEIIQKIADEKGMSVSRLSVSDLFVIDAVDCDTHEEEGHKGFTITLKADTLKNLVSVIRFDGEKWGVVDILEWNEEAGTVTIHTDELGVFAFVVDNGAPQTGDNTMVYIGIMVAAAVGLTVVLVSLKRRKV